jgi:hypothetical protein
MPAGWRTFWRTFVERWRWWGERRRWEERDVRIWERAKRRDRVEWMKERRGGGRTVDGGTGEGCRVERRWK